MPRPRGQSKPLSVSQSQHIYKKLRTKRARHDLALYTTGLDTMLRSIDLLRLKMRDVLNSRGQIIEQLTWWQKKNKRNVKLTLTPETQAALKQWIEFSGKQPDDYLFTRHKKGAGAKPITRSHYATMVKEWVQLIDLPPDKYATHTLRRTKAQYLYETGRSTIEDLAVLLGHADINSTRFYLNIQAETSAEQAREGNIFRADPHEPVLSPVARQLLQPEFLDLLAEELWRRFTPKISDLLDENKNREDNDYEL